MKFGMQEIKEFCENHEDERVRIVYKRLQEARSKNAQWCEALEKSPKIPHVIEQVEDFDCPWVVTFKNDGGSHHDVPREHCALYFKNHDEAKAWIELARTKYNGTRPRFDAFPLRQI